MDGLDEQVDSTDPLAKSTEGQFIDISKVDKFELTAEEYEARPGRPTSSLLLGLQVNACSSPNHSPHPPTRHRTRLQTTPQARSLRPLPLRLLLFLPSRAPPPRKPDPRRTLRSVLVVHSLPKRNSAVRRSHRIRAKGGSGEGLGRGRVGRTRWKGGWNVSCAAQRLFRLLILSVGFRVIGLKGKGTFRREL